MSRLRESSERIRDELDTRNIYTPENPYRLEEGALVSALDNLAGAIAPFDSIDISNSIVGRLIGPNTPIQRIGTAMLGKQQLYNVRSQASAEFLPTVSFSNLFDGNPDTKLFNRKIDYQITRRSQTKSGQRPKAFSYCQTIVRNFYKDHSRKSYQEKKTILSWEDHSSDILEQSEYLYEIDDNGLSNQC